MHDAARMQPSPAQAEAFGRDGVVHRPGLVPPAMVERLRGAVDRAMAAPGDPVSLDELKLIVLMVYWSFGTEPDALVLDELCDDTEHRVAH